MTASPQANGGEQVDRLGPAPPLAPEAIDAIFENLTDVDMTWVTTEWDLVMGHIAGMNGHWLENIIEGEVTTDAFNKHTFAVLSIVLVRLIEKGVLSICPPS